MAHSAPFVPPPKEKQDFFQLCRLQSLSQVPSYLPSSWDYSAKWKSVRVIEGFEYRSSHYGG